MSTIYLQGYVFTMIEYWSEHQTEVQKYSDSYLIYASSISHASNINIYWMQNVLVFVIFFIILICKSLIKLVLCRNYAVNALTSLYISLNKPSQLTNWNATGGDPCGENWLGVTCSGTNVTKLYVTCLQVHCDGIFKSSET